jgi:glycerol-3-phosphate acyltransferase PlsX
MAKIAVDAMGGDRAPAPIVAGAVQAAARVREIETLYLVGDEGLIRAELAACGGAVPDCLEIVHASQVVGMDESPAVAVRRKKDSSISRAVDLVRDGAADAVFSAGNTGAAVAATAMKLRALEGVDRPAIAAVIPTQTRPFVLLDAGATPDCTPRMLVQFAVMGTVYAREILRIEAPRVGLISIGVEDAKGNEVTKEAFRLLERSGLHFVGNVEGGDLFSNRVDVAVCDGFVGNVVLKTSESTARALYEWIKEAISSRAQYRLGAWLCRGAFARIKRKADPAVYGGAPLLGVNGVCIIGHGSSNAEAAANGIRVAAESVEHHINPRIVELLKTFQAAPGA